MADRKLINPAIVKDIADAIREKGGTTEQIKVADLGDAVRALPEGGGVGEDTSALLDAIGVESREDTGMANGLAIALTDAPLESSWSGERSVADGEPIKDGVAFVSTLKGKTMKVNQLANIGTTTLRGVTITNNGDGSYTLNGTATANTNAILCDLTPYENGQKFLFALKTTNPKLYLYESSNGKKSVTNEIYTRAIGRRYGFYIEEGATFSNEKITFLAVHLNAVGMESITTADQFANAFGYATIADLPPIPYTPTTNLQSFAPKAIVSKREGAIPSAYQEVEYLESHGTEKIVTDITFKNDVVAEVKCAFLGTPPSSGNMALFSPLGSTNASGYVGIDSSGKWGLGGGFNLPNNYADILEFTYQRTGTQAVITNSNGDSAERSSNISISSFALFSASPTGTAREMRIYYVKVDDGTTKIDLVPCYRKSDGEAGFYDRENGVFYTNTASGTFALSAEVYPLGRLDFNLTTIVDSQGNQLFPDGELKSAGSVCDLVDYANNVAVKRIGVVDMGTLDYQKYDVAQGTLFRGTLYTVKKSPSSNFLPAILVVRYTTTTQNNRAEKTLSMAVNTLGVDIIDSSFSDAGEFKASMSGMLLYYELETPIQVPIDPTKAWYPVQNNGTEEAITDSIVPMNAEIRYRVDTESLLTQSASLLRYSNEVTGADNTSLGDAVKTLTDNYK